jgi:hypothetical protein
MNNKRILLGLILGFLILSFIPTSQGCGTVKRSLEDDWLYQADGQTPLNDYIGYWVSEELIAYPHLESNWNFVSILDCNYYGHILDREMPDGRHMITVHMIVKGAPVMIETFNPSNPVTLFAGEMNYIFQLKFIIDIDIWPAFLVPWLDDDGFDNETGYVILPGYLPLAFDSLMWYEFGLEFVSVLFIGQGKGEMLNEWNDLELGDAAKVIVATYGSAKEGYNFIDPFMPLWPLDFIKLY